MSDGHESRTEYDEKALLERLQPSLGDWDYLILKDIVAYVKGASINCAGRLLDFGCGRSPYRGLFPRCEYLRADLDMSKGADFVVAEDGTLNAPTGGFNVILSTQVAEHVMFPNVYFSEAFRLLQPGGVLILTTHGMWEDHAVPYDFQRWTADGLERDLRSVGFVDVHVTRLSCESRALWQMISHHWSMCLEGPGLLRGIFRLIWRNVRPLVHYLADRSTAHWAIVDGKSKLYLGVATTCRKAG